MSSSTPTRSPTIAYPRQPIRRPPSYVRPPRPARIHPRSAHDPPASSTHLCLTNYPPYLRLMPAALPSAHTYMNSYFIKHREDLAKQHLRRASRRSNPSQRNYGSQLLKPIHVLKLPLYQAFLPPALVRILQTARRDTFAPTKLDGRPTRKGDKTSSLSTTCAQTFPDRFLAAHPSHSRRDPTLIIRQEEERASNSLQIVFLTWHGMAPARVEVDSDTAAPCPLQPC
ncbi:hypothetical protein BZA70DRAFT_266393 [Myxozyma melibiosi]|uniref:Uncharacterized protein n=1 Tax=Myxozyma melibiosi TaxID=54550 RepID=A0ABR1F898_9ASCO